ncbi:hypothetical protein [Nocardiopsis ganjiahuensis]|uniref:hypothetical protein n=1 Tax=Nocardiopsis ganjiahuensis TaxID=239984 RepID=UPI00034DEB60|nr:hypothetical protein [Nocardiopsis ganjiahuensis]
MSTTRTALVGLGSAIVASAATAAILLPMGAFADSADDPAKDWGECSGPRTKTISLEEALPYLAEEDTFPAEGDLDGYEVGYVPESADGTPFDTSWEAEEDIPASTSRSWLSDEAELETWLDENGEIEEQYAYADGPLSVTVERDEDFTDVDAYFELYYESTPEEYFEGENVQDLPFGGGYYTGIEAIWSPEPGVVLSVHLWNEEEFVEPDGAEDEAIDEEWYPEGDPEEVLRIAEGITPA